MSHHYQPQAQQRRAQTYDSYASPSSDYADGSGGHASSARSRSMRNPVLDADVDPNDPPLPSYSALMASESAAGISHSPQPMTDSASSHARTPSLEHAPYAPVDYGPPSSAGYSSSQHGHGYAYDGSSKPNPNRLSAGSINRRPISDPNNIDFSSLSITAANPGHQQAHASPPNPPSRHQTAPPQQQPYPQRGPYPRQRTTTGGYPTSGGGEMDGAASVYSLDSGMGAYSGVGGGGGQQQGYPGPGYGGAGASGGYGGPLQPAPDFSNPYYSAANDFLGLPPGSEQPYVPTASSSTLPPSRQQSTSTLARTNTSATTLSNASSLSLSRNVTEQVGASSTRRRGTQAAVDLNKPPYTKQYVDDYRKRMKDDPDPEAQFAFSKYLIEAAKKLGDEISQTDPKLGRKYRDVLLQESLRNIKKLAESKEPYPDAQFFLANLYGTGQLGLQVDHEKAYYLYLMASKLNHPAATYRSAVCNEIGAGTRKDPNRAVLFYRKAAALGDTAAMYKLGMILLGGLLMQPRNPREAIVWLRRAASQADEDNPHALHELALLHERPSNGAIVPHDINMARELFTQAAQLGYAPAQFKLGSCHEFGHLGCPIDPRRSIAWYTRAAEKGDSEAELALSGWYLTGSEGVLKQSDTEAYLWGRKAANKGLAKAEYAVGYYTEIGIGVKQDLDQAKRWYMRAAAQQHKRAMQRLTELNNAKNPRGKGARPTRSDAQSECVVM
ncbi:enzyme activator [Kwoniella heveanensis BCC8398]|uniref:Enzyme activator n=1 Tax=Kwoniella heveanensis BCC8398 TaxID=1296120 RepID=A0A1B9GK27_9TREE|nr:enzyme activator [Kwoniella heveanensis BCC8398]